MNPLFFGDFMTEHEYIIRHNELLGDVPKEFKGYLSKLSWDLGHSAGYREVLNYLSGLTYEFMEAFREYEKNIKK